MPLRLDEMTWPEVEEAIANGIRTVVIAVGAVEQHGPCARRMASIRSSRSVDNNR